MRWWGLIICAITSSGCAGQIECDVAPPSADGAPSTLSETGLFCGDPDPIAADVIAYEPAFALWSDGMNKRRWLQLPNSGMIDTSDMDHWSFPVGTRLWKQITHENDALETRLAERWGAGDSDWSYATYRWRADGQDADLLLTGERDVEGTAYDVPTAGACSSCHNSLPERVLGFSAIQLQSPAGRQAASQLADRFTHPPAPRALEADDVTRGALGMLHANCGNCHHDGPNAVGTSMQLRLRVDMRTVEETATYRTTVGVATDGYSQLETRIVAGDPSASALFFRLSSRGNADQMPPLGTERIDHGGAIAVGTWISGL